MTECIHGLEIDRCDACSPRVPKTAIASAAAKTARPKPARKSAPIASSAPKPVDPGNRRIFHMTHIRNLPGILDSGRILSDLSGAHPTIDISAPDNRERRRDAVIGSARVASFVPFFLAADALLWESILAGSADSRLHAVVRTTPAADFVMLVSTIAAGGSSAIMADGDATDPRTVFSSPADLGRMPRRTLDDDNGMRVAEYLVPDELAFSSVSLIGVANEKVRSSVREQLAAHALSQKVSVYPPWFQPST